MDYYQQCYYRPLSPCPHHTCWSAFFQISVAVSAARAGLPRAKNDRDQVTLARIRTDMDRLRPHYWRIFRLPCNHDPRTCSQIP